MGKLIHQLEPDANFQFARDEMRELFESNINSDGTINEDNLCYLLETLGVKFNDDGTRFEC